MGTRYINCLDDNADKIMYKKFVSLNEGAELYSLGLETFRELAEKAGALYKPNKRILVNTELLEEYLETFRI